MAYDVFLSYSRRDNVWVDDFCTNLDKAGVKFFRDTREIKETLEIDPKITDALDSSDYLLLVVSPNAMASPWVRKEINDRAKNKRSILLAQIATAPLPISKNDGGTFDFETFDFEPKYEKLEDYRQLYLEQFAKLCTRLGKLPFRPLSNTTHAPLRQLPGLVYGEVIDLLAHVVKWPATRKGFCSMLDLPPDHLDTEPNLRLAANYLVHSIAVREMIPNDRACRKIMQTLQLACNFEGILKLKLERTLANVQSCVAEEVDDEFVSNVRRAIGDRYDILKILGGSFTIVLQAKDNTLKRNVIVKVLRPRVVPKNGDSKNQRATLSQPKEVSEPFQYYSEIAASVDHPTFNRLYGARFTEEVNLCITEYFPGVGLGELVRCKAILNLSLVTTILQKIGTALIDLESMELAQTCLNPENMFINPQGQLKISPFGIAKIGDVVIPIPELYKLARTPSRRAQLYCGPEEQSGDAPYRADRRAHQFGFGMLALELLKGSPVDVDHGNPDTKVQVSDQVEGWLPIGLRNQPDRLVVRTLQKLLNANPEQRFQNTKEALRALRHAIRASIPPEQAGSRGLDQLAEVVRQVQEETQRRVDAAERARRSLSEILTDSFLEKFHDNLELNDEVKKIFTAQWSNRPPSEVRASYFEKLRGSLRSIVDYGTYPGYESLSLERVVSSHRGYGVAPELYPVFITTLMKTLGKWDPPFGATKDVGEVRRGWEFLTQHVLNYVQGMRENAEGADRNHFGGKPASHAHNA